MCQLTDTQAMGNEKLPHYNDHYFFFFQQIMHTDKRLNFPVLPVDIILSFI
jgi:hypothetical protein